MAEHVGHSFLNDTKYCGFQFGRKPRELRRLYIKRSLDAAAFCKPFEQPMQGRDETDFVQQRWMEEMRNAADLLNGTVDHGARFAGSRLARGTNRRVPEDNSVNGHFCSRKFLT